MFFTMTLAKGGAERVLTTLCNNWKNDEVSIVTCLSEESPYVLNETIKKYELIDKEEYKKKGKIGTFFKICSEYKQIANLIKPDVVISFLPEPCIVSKLMNKSVKSILIGSERGNPYYQYSSVEKLLMNYIYGHMDGVVFQTDGARKYFNNRVQQKSVVIGNPIDKGVFASGERMPKTNEIVSVGRFTPEKNYKLLIQSFKDVVIAHPEVVLHIYGRIDKSLGIQELIEEQGLSNSVVLEGEVDNIQDRIRNANAFVMSSKSEGMPNALLEAMALGLPVISTDCPPGGPRELIENEMNGLLVQNENAKELSDAIIRIIEDESLAANLGKNASKVINKYSTDVVIDKWNDYIQSMINQKQ